ncbi:MAG: TetR/AcrR family transcriptional regulator [Chloroflexota bacterium]
MNETEDKILRSATDIFFQKGYLGARMQEIADAAGVNKAMLHYYFRSKKDLYEKIISSLLGDLTDSISQAIDIKLDFKEVISVVVEKYIDFLIANPRIPMFILSEIQQNFDMLAPIFLKGFDLLPRNLMELIQREAIKGKIKPVNPFQIFINILSLCIFPFASKPLLTLKFELDNEEFIKLMQSRKTILPEFILSGIQNL